MLFLSINLHYFIVPPFQIYFSSWLRICGLRQRHHHLILARYSHFHNICLLTHHTVNSLSNKDNWVSKQLYKEWKQNERMFESEIKPEWICSANCKFYYSTWLSLKFANVFFLDGPLNVHMQITSWKIVPNSSHICDFSLKKLVEMH